MRIVIDTSSLLALVRYYLPFDKDKVLYIFIKTKIEEGEIIIIDAVYDECAKVSDGLVVKELDFITKSIDRKKHINEAYYIAYNSTKFINLVENTFVRQAEKKRLLDKGNENFTIQKEIFLKSADCLMIIYCNNLIQHYSNSNEMFSREDIFLVTEETERENDNKLFHKLPKICRVMNIDILTIPDLLAKYNDDLKIIIKQ